MKKIIGYFKEHFKDGFNPWYYAYTTVFLVVTISINYHLDFEDKVLDRYFFKPEGMLYYFLFYAFSYYMIAIPGAFFMKKIHLFWNYQFWLKSLAFIGLIGVMAGFYQYQDMVKDLPPLERGFLRKLLMNLKRFVPYVLVLFIIQKIFDKNVKGLYGLRFRGTNLKPYFILLLMVFPLIAGASFLPDFLKQYPVLVIPSTNDVTEDQINMVKEYVSDGGIAFVFDGQSLGFPQSTGTISYGAGWFYVYEEDICKLYYESYQDIFRQQFIDPILSYNNVSIIVTPQNRKTIITPYINKESNKNG